VRVRACAIIRQLWEKSIYLFNNLIATRWRIIGVHWIGDSQRCWLQRWWFRVRYTRGTQPPATHHVRGKDLDPKGRATGNIRASKF